MEPVINGLGSLTKQGKCEMSVMDSDRRLLAGEEGKCRRKGFSVKIMRFMILKRAVTYLNSTFFHELLPLGIIGAVLDPLVKLIRIWAD
jgi:hypothetical protein